MLMYINEVGFFSQRPLVQFMLSGVFDRFPRLKFVMTETGCAWVPPLLKRLDAVTDKIRKTGQTGEIRYGKEHILKQAPSEYFRRHCWMGVSQPGPDDAKALPLIGLDRFMWGSDYPHDEGTYPFTRQHLRQVFPGTDPGVMQQVLAENAAALYQFDLDRLAPLAARVGPTVDELAEPLTELPPDPNEALLRGAGSMFG
jgi:predicted TIM-barrel fold metal-dependent hydrolase